MMLFRMPWRLLILALLVAGTVPAVAADDPLAESTYKMHCAQCHDQGGTARIPTLDALHQLTPSAINRALEFGAMKAQGMSITRAERQALATWIGRGRSAAVVGESVENRCEASPALTAAAPSRSALSSWGAGLDNWRFTDEATAGFTAADVPNLKLKWAFGLPNTATIRSQPAFYAGRVFLAGQDAIYSLDADSGCIHWAVTAVAAVRTALVIASVHGRIMLYFGDIAGQVHALDASSGADIWQVQADEHPATYVTASPVYHNGKLYVATSSAEEARPVSPGYVCCTFRGSVQALDAATGKRLWKTYAIAEAAKLGKPTKAGVMTMGPSGAGIWSAPTLDPERNTLYVTTGDNYSDPPTATSDAVLALAMDSGKLLWSKQLFPSDVWNSACSLANKSSCPDAAGPDFDFGAPAMLVHLAGGRRLLVLAQKSGMLRGVDPDQRGKILWQAKVGQGGTLGGIQWGASTDGSLVYVGLSDIGFSSVGALGRTLDPKRGGGMFAFRADNGERMWMTPPPGCGTRANCSPAQSQAVSAIPGAVFSGSVDGHLRAYGTADGKILWDFDTAQEFMTVNDVAAKGGSLDAGGPVMGGGMLFVGSGYGQWGGMPGNVLLAFGTE
jgi:polyvinyl alcohol dehydrogenase (cytochrome)